MNIERPQAHELTQAEKVHLQKLTTLLEYVLADGVLSRAERDQVIAAVQADGTITVEEVALLWRYIYNETAKGRIELDYSTP